MSSRQPAPSESWGYTGADIAKQAKVEREQAEQRAKNRGAFRFYLNKGEEAEIIILDKSDRTFSFHEHCIPGPGKNWKQSVYITSPRTLGQEDPLENYPLDNLGGDCSNPYFVQFYTILDLRGYTSKKTGKHVPYTRKLLPVKLNQIEEFAKLADVSKEHYGTFRGFHMKLVRTEAQGPGNTSIGKPTPIGVQYGHLSEEEMTKRYGHAEVKNKDGKIIIPKNGYLLPYEYTKLFEKPDADKIRKRFGIGAPIGSDSELEEDWNKTVEDDLGSDEDQNPEVDDTELSEDDIPF